MTALPWNVCDRLILELSQVHVGVSLKIRPVGTGVFSQIYEPNGDGIVSGKILLGCNC
jgi:hypothetical protein